VKFGTDYLRTISLSDCEFVRISAVKTTLYLGAYTKFYPYFPHLLSNSGEIWCKRSAHDVVVHLTVSRKLAREGAYSSYGCKQNYIHVCAAKLNNISNVKNAS